MERVQLALVYSSMLTALVSITMLLGTLAHAGDYSAPVRTVASAAITDEDAGYDQAAYDECMDSSETSNTEVCQ